MNALKNYFDLITQNNQKYFSTCFMKVPIKLHAIKKALLTEKTVKRASKSKLIT
jgi:hypothetical protein